MTKYAGTMFLVDGGGTAVVTGTVDGGAHWTGGKDSLLGRGVVNDGVVAGGADASSLEKGGYLFAVQGTDTKKAALTLEKDAVLQNNAREGYYADGNGSPGDADRGGAVCLLDYGSMTMNEEAVIQNCSVTTAKDPDTDTGLDNEAAENQTGSEDPAVKIGGGAAVCVFGGEADFTMNGGTISGCYAEQSGGAVRVLGKFTMNGGTISDNQSEAFGAGVMIQLGTMSLSGAVTIKGNELTDGTANDVYTLDMANPNKAVIPACWAHAYRFLRIRISKMRGPSKSPIRKMARQCMRRFMKLRS